MDAVLMKGAIIAPIARCIVVKYALYASSSDLSSQKCVRACVRACVGLGGESGSISAAYSARVCFNLLKLPQSVEYVTSRGAVHSTIQHSNTARS